MLSVSLEILKSLSLQSPRSLNYPAPHVAKRCRSIITLKLSPSSQTLGREGLFL